VLIALGCLVAAVCVLLLSTRRDGPADRVTRRRDWFDDDDDRGGA
jgi:hypothetical protein